MCSPSGVCNASVRVKDLGHVDAGAVDELSQLGNLAHLFESKDFISLVAIDCETRRIVTSVFKAGQAYAGSMSAEALPARTMSPYH